MAPIRRGLTTRPARAAAGPAAPAAEARAAYEPWRSLVDLAALMAGATGAAAAVGGERVHYPASNLRWFEAELRTLLEGGQAARLQRGTPRSLAPRGAEGARRLLAYLEGEESGSERAARPRPAPTAGVAGPVVAPETPAPVRPARTRLEAKTVRQRPPRASDQVQGTEVAASREIIAPWLGMRVPDVSIQPLLTTGGGGSGSSSAGGGGGTGSPDPEHVAELADQVYDILKERLEFEHNRWGG